MNIDIAASKEAKEIYDTYYIICMKYTKEILCSVQAKKCALECINKIISSCDTDAKVYYEEVKHQIEKISWIS